MSSISETMVDEKIKHIEATEANLLIGADMGCLMNIGEDCVGKIKIFKCYM